MSFPQQKFREIVFQVIFSLDMSSSIEDEMISLIMNELCVTKKIVKEAQSRALMVWEKKSEIDDLIETTSKDYEFDRIQRAERNALRLGIYELIFDKEKIPPKVVIAEAIRICRKFSTPEAANFVNAVLDALFQKQENP